MKLSRRGFLGILGTAAVSAGVGAAFFELDPERLLWTPGERTIFLPPETRLVAGEDAVAAYSRIQQSGRRVWTAVGFARFDAHECLVEINGHKVTAVEAARLQASHYQRGTRPTQSVDEVLTMVVAQRVRAGWADPLGTWTGALPHNPVGNGWKA